MIRKAAHHVRRPLRPLARVIAARAKGNDPAPIEQEIRQARQAEMNSTRRRRSEGRMFLLGGFFVLCFSSVAVKMAIIAGSGEAAPIATPDRHAILAERADIVDRNGAVLATNVQTNALYVETRDLVDPRAAAYGLARIFPDLNADTLYEKFTGKQTFHWVRKVISPEQQQAVHDLGEPGLKFGSREMRLYPNAAVASHILGGAGFGREGVRAAEVVGRAGVEKWFDTYLRDPEAGKPLELSLDISAQIALEQVLAQGMADYQAKGAGAVLMEAKTGRIVAMASLPDFDPNNRPLPGQYEDPALSPLFNRVAQGNYELGSTFKLFAVANAMEKGLVGPYTVIDIRGPWKWGKYTIRDFRNYGNELSVTDIMVKSSNIGSAKLAVHAGKEAQQNFLKGLGFFSPLPVELTEAAGSMPMLPPRWSELSTMTVSYGHGIAATPLHLATAYATMVNGGLKVTPSLLKDSPLPTEADRIISEENSARLRDILRQVVTRGTASKADVAGYEVGAKTGTADKPNPQGGYYENKVLATFAGVFPASDPEYVLVLSLDEPVAIINGTRIRTAGWTAVPVAAKAIERVAPLMGLRPKLDKNGGGDNSAPKVTLATTSWD
ncbi:peptidoglycan D,D-transpeptidase FtsI family protein [Paracoccaceae bacterium GXU_MW_L88]